VVDKFRLLPAFWKGMLPAERQQIIQVIGSHGGDFTIDCLRQLNSECSIPYSDMQKVRVCYDVSEELPETVFTELPEPCDQIDVAAAAVPQEHIQLVANAKASLGLINFERFPAGLQGVDLLNHMTLFEKRRCKGAEKLRPSPGLDIAMSADQELLFNPSAEDLTIREILRDAGGDGAVKKMAQRKLDSVAFVNAFSCYANSELRIKRFKQAARLTASLAEISKLTQEADLAKKGLESDLMKDIAPGALRKLRSKNMDFNSITVKELHALAYEYYNEDLPAAGNKKVKADKITELYLKNQARLDQVILPVVE
jgi:hypothetical protein